MKLYHFTSRESLDGIIFDGSITGADLRINKNRDRIGLCGVWLTSKPDLDIDHGMPDTKREVRITVDLPNRDVKRWQSWARGRGIKQESIKAATARGGQSWRISTLNIRPDNWVEAIDTSTGEVLMTLDMMQALPQIVRKALALDLQEQFDALTEAEQTQPLVAGVPLTEAQIIVQAVGIRSMLTLEDLLKL